MEPTHGSLTKSRRAALRTSGLCAVLLAASLLATQFGSDSRTQASVPVADSDDSPAIGFEPVAPLPTVPEETTTTEAGSSTTTEAQSSTTVESVATTTNNPEGVAAVEGVGLIAGWETVSCDGTGEGGVLKYRLFISDGRTIERERVDPAGSYSIEADEEWGPLPSAIFWTVSGTAESGFDCQFA